MNTIKNCGNKVIQFKVSRTENGVEVWAKSKVFEDFFRGLHPKNADGTPSECEVSDRWRLPYYHILTQGDVAQSGLLVNSFGNMQLMNGNAAQASFIRAVGLGRDEVRDAAGNVTDPGGIKVVVSTSELMSSARVRQYIQTLKTGLAQFYREFIEPVNVTVDIISKEVTR